MMTHNIKRITAGIALVIFAAVPVLADDPPQWLKQAAAMSVPSYDSKVNAVVLYKETNVVIDEGGHLTKTNKYAVKVLNRDGRREAVAVEDYIPNFSQVKDMQAWLIAAGGTVTNYGKKDMIDQVANPNDVYEEVRLKILDGRQGAGDGSVFGYSSTTEDHPLFYQDEWSFQDDLPTLVSRYTVTLPGGWTASGITFNHSEVTPQSSGTSYTWELRDLAPIADEPMRPSFANLAPRLSVNITPARPEQAVNRSFTDWTAVSRWATAMYDPQVVIDDNVAAKARELSAGAKSEIEIIRAIATYVQNMQYIALDIGVGYGNGMKPRPSNEVLARGYADCKNKANLMRAMLKVMRIEAYPIAIYAGDPSYVRKEFPTPHQFNHCIIAVKVSDATQAPTVVQNEKLGRLLIFDATDPYTRVGDLPGHLQGSFGLIMAGDNGGLITMPVIDADKDALQRTIEATITETGEIKGKIHETSTGQTAAAFRAESRMLSASDLRKAIEGWLTNAGTGAQLVSMAPKDGVEGFDMDVDFSAPRYGQIMQGRLLVFKPVFVSRRRDVYLTDSKRATPVELDSMSMNETATFTLPAGFAVDETPDPVSLDTAFGKYNTSYEVKGDKLVFKRSLTTKRSLVPVDKYDLVRAFFTKMRDAEQAPVVLIKK